MAKLTPLKDDVRMQGGSVQNIVSLYLSATPKQLADGQSWYAKAREVALEIHPYGIGILAALSPQLDYDLNVEAARELVATGKAHRQTKPNIRKALAIMNGADPLTLFSEKNAPKTRNFYLAILGAAIKWVGTEGKAVIDRHAKRIWQGFKNAGEEREVTGGSDALRRVGAYDWVSDDYMTAGQILDVHFHIAQAVTWVVQRT
jgi:hypothetical protein